MTAVVTVAMVPTDAAIAAPTPTPPAAGGASGAPAAGAPAGGYSRPDLTTAQALAHQVKARVEVLGERTETSATFVNADGTISVQTFTGPRWVKRWQLVDGEKTPLWVDVDPTLVANPDGTVTPKAVTSGLVLSGGGDTVLARLVKNGIGQSTSAGVLKPDGTTGVLPKPTLSGSTATYPEVQPGVDLTVTVTRSGYETNWVIKARPSGPLHLDLPVTLSGVTASTRLDGGVAYKDAAGKPALITRAPQMWDATRDPETKQPKRVRGVPLALSATSTLPTDAEASGSPQPGASASGAHVASAAGDAASSAAATTSTSASNASGATTADPSSAAGVPGVRLTGRGLLSARVNAAAGVPGAKGGVSVRHLGLSPDAGFLADPATVFPVTVDPSVNWSEASDTYVKSTTPNTSYYTDGLLQIGYDGSAVYRSYVQAPVDVYRTLQGKAVVGAYLQVYNSYSSTCGTGSNTSIYTFEDDVTYGMDTTYSNKPTRTPSTAQSATIFNPAHGRSTCGGGAYDNIDITQIAKDWATASYTKMAVEVGAGETDAFGYKQFYSGNSAHGGIPSFTITYGSYPDAPANVTPATGVSIPTDSFTGTASISDADGDYVQGQVFIQDVTAGNTWTTPSTGSYCDTVASGGTTTCTWGNLVNGHTYQWQMRAVKNIANVVVGGPYTAWRTFTVDTTAPAAATVSSTAYPASSWNPAAPTAGSFTFSSISSDVTQFRYWFNNGTRSTIAATGSTPRTASLSLTPPIGPDVLHVQALDAANNASIDPNYSFGAGVAVTSPKDGARTQAQVVLQAAAPTTATKVTFSYKTTAATTWTTIPASDVTLNGNTATWPLATAVDAQKASAPSTLRWNVAQTLGAGVNDGAYQVQATFTDNSTGTWTSTNAPTLLVDRAAFGDSYATTAAGPGSVSLLTGNYSMTATDASVPGFNGDMTVRRTFNSFAPTQSGPFGPGWMLALNVDTAGSSWSGVADLGSFVKVKDTAGGGSYFGLQADGTYTPLGDTQADALTLTKTGTGTSAVYTVKDTEGNATTFAYASGTGTVSPFNVWSYRVDTVTQPGTSLKTTARYNSDGTPDRLLAPTPPGQTCDDSNFVPGCRALTFAYASGKVTSIGLKVALSNGIVINGQVACYSYDGNGRLSQAWDPRINGTTCGSPILPISYGYNTSTGTANSGKVTTVTPAGLAAWNIGYTAGTGTDPYTGKLDTVSRTHNAANGSGTETSTVRYQVPFGTPTNPEDNPDLSGTAAAAWAQTDLPVTASVVYSPGDTVSATSLRDGDVTGIDIDGRAVNSASFSGTGQRGWLITTSEYDTYGNIVRSLSAGNRDRAVHDTSGTATRLGLPANSTSAWLSRALDTTTIYSADGTDALESFDPYHQVSIPGSGSLVGARAHTKTTYGTRTVADTDPTVDGPLHHPIQTTTGASQSGDATVVNEVDVRTTKSAYGLSGDKTGWTFKAPTRVTTVVPGGTDIVRETVLDPATGLVIQTRQPSAAGTSSSAGTRVTAYYTMTGSGSCVQPAWVNLPCTVTPGAQPGVAGLPQLPTVKYSNYDYLNRVLQVDESVVDASGSTHTRSTGTWYDNNGWSLRALRIYTSGDLGTPVPAVKPTYDAATGLPTGSTTDTTPAPAAGMAGTLTTAYDDFGRTTSTTDANSATTTQSYDTAGRPWVTTWKKTDGTTLAARTLGYNSATERRGLATTATDSDAGAITGTYDADGAIQTQTWPNSLVQTLTRDTTGDTVDLADVRAGVTWAHHSQSSNIHGQWTTYTTDGVATRTYTYSNAGRLITAAPLRAGGDPCEKRTYTFDVNGNRTSLARTITSGGSCVAGTTTTLSYDAADRLQPTGTASGTIYDAWGRIITLPAALAGTIGNSGDVVVSPSDLTSGYYVTDAAANQTQAGNTDTWTLDPAGRRRVSSLLGQPKTNHYDDTSDNPAWIDEGQADHAITRYISDLAGSSIIRAVTSDSGTTLKYQLATLHGDILTTSSANPTGNTPDGATLDTDEYGNWYAGGRRYGWLGDKQRSSDALGGTVLMGARLYNPTTGRFLSVDPVYGGNETPYGYPNDPINLFDLDGRSFWDVVDVVGAVATGLSFVPIPGVEEVAAGVALGATALNLAHDVYNWKTGYGSTADTVMDLAGLATFGLGRALKVAGPILRARAYGKAAQAFPKGVRGSSRANRAGRRAAVRSSKASHKRATRAHAKSSRGIDIGGVYHTACNHFPHAACF